MRYAFVTLGLLVSGVGCSEQDDSILPTSNRSRTASSNSVCNRACDSIDTCGFPNPWGGSDCASACVDTHVAECQGSGTAQGTVNGLAPTVGSGFGGLQQGATNVYLFSRDVLEMVNLPGTSGEWKIRVMLTGSLGGNDYSATMFAGQWSTGSQSWSGQTTETAIVTITGYHVVDGTGLLCNGYIIGHAEALFVGNEPFAVTFAVPMLTPSFPSAL